MTAITPLSPVLGEADSGEAELVVDVVVLLAVVPVVDDVCPDYFVWHMPDRYNAIILTCIILPT